MSLPSRHSSQHGLAVVTSRSKIRTFEAAVVTQKPANDAGKGGLTARDTIYPLSFSGNNGAEATQRGTPRFRRPLMRRFDRAWNGRRRCIGDPSTRISVSRGCSICTGRVFLQRSRAAVGLEWRVAAETKCSSCLALPKPSIFCARQFRRHHADGRVSLPFTPRRGALFAPL